MDKLQAILTAKLATRLEQVLAAQLDAALDAAIEQALDRLLGAEPTPADKPTTAKPKKAKAEPTSTTTTSDKPKRVRAEPEPVHPTSYEEFTSMLVAAQLGKSKSGKELSTLWGNRAAALRKHYEEKHGIPVPWGKLWGFVAQDSHLPTRLEGNARELAKALGLPVGE